MTYACRKTDEWQTVRYENGYGSVIAPSRQRHYPMRTTVQSLLHINPPPAHSPLFCRKMRHSRAFRLSACHSAACSLSPSATVFSVSPNGLFLPAIEPLSCRGRAFAACRKSPSGMPEEQSVRCVASFSSCRLDENGAAAPSPPCRDTVSVPSPSLFCRFALSKIFTWRIRFRSFPSSLSRSAVAP